MITFLDPDYKAPSVSASYFKPQTGENKIRILSKPVMGWEDWIDNKPVRFAMDKKPAKSADAKKPIKHFWAFIVWNYAESQIQIFNLTQASVRKSIESFCKDSDWGAPFFYDIKITKKGEKMDTEYLVTPLPHKPIGEDIIRAFQAKPCNLEALFTGEDPFSHLSDSFTPGVFTKAADLELKTVDVKQIDIARVDADQAQTLIDVLSECDEDYKKQTWEFWKQAYKIKNIDELPASEYEKILKGAMARINENVQKELKQGRKK